MFGYENANTCGRFAMVIDNLFTPEDCTRYVAAAEASKDWEVAAVNAGPDTQVCIIFSPFQTQP
jgi:hypothetical protein